MSDETRQAPPGAGFRRRHPFEPAPGKLGAGPEQLAARGKIGELVPQGGYLALLGLMAQLRQRRESMGLSLAEAAERSGLTRQAINKLENGRTANPTVATLWRYALALDAGVTLGIEELEEGD